MARNAKISVNSLQQRDLFFLTDTPLEFFNAWIQMHIFIMHNTIITSTRFLLNLLLLDAQYADVSQLQLSKMETLFILLPIIIEIQISEKTLKTKKIVF